MLRAFIDNEPAIKRLLSRYFHRRQDIDDIAQETFLRAFAAEADQDILAPRAFLFRVARNLALNERARMSHSTTDYLEDFQNLGPLSFKADVSSEDAVIGRQKLMAFAEAISSLPPQCRRVFLLRKIHGVPQKEIAAELGVSVGTVEKHIALGLVRCRDYLRARGHEVAGAPAPGASVAQFPGPAVLAARRRGRSDRG